MMAAVRREKPTRQAEVAVQELEQSPWKVILYNDDIHTFDEVILQLQKATGCSLQRAEQIAWTAHRQGKAVAYEGDLEDCLRVQGVLGEIGLITEIQG
ncbi:MAG: ATP-dependent Clp protease adaptor ClpS [Bacteroidetes bacterium]|nr:ATP-dependent Clp protease adaptor ClpS [Rhodothermia bacterium]MCS7154485.1 ATP-dependent Clp protease adaptor ClpS [Bacteroidota bacterium]MCX7906858.1 ATP-dependent Clp protease adaptor ClpS [Bacteroidota bacterium]MDW8136863.1 ATP-dependent Clp protease adaptor ClpS [Bacteroidota bacterium]MDW8285267.1 ATP-dependent Clp protease adaptor ClpS [Bacteroidota bacterium]